MIPFLLHQRIASTAQSETLSASEKHFKKSSNTQNSNIHLVDDTAQDFTFSSGSKIDFFNNEEEQKAKLNKLNSYIVDLLIEYEENNRYEKNLQSLLEYLSFMGDYLFSNYTELSFVSNTSSDKKQISREERIFYNLCGMINNLISKEYWKLKHSHNELNTSLIELAQSNRELKNFEKTTLSELCIMIFTIACSAFGTIVVILLITDILKAFFDLTYNSFYKH